MPGIFISYRREDSAGHAGRLFDRLKEHFGTHRVFMDVTTIKPGLDFVEAIEQAVSSCDMLLVVIGKEWLTCEDPSGRRRLDDPRDFIRLETATALKRDIPVVPVLVQGARVPGPGELPEDLEKLSRRQAVELSDSRWDSDVRELIKSLSDVLGERSLESPPPRPETVPPTRVPFRRAAPIVAAAMLVIGGILTLFLLRRVGIEVPPLVGRTLDVAKAILKDRQLGVGAVNDEESQERPGIVLRQTPQAGERVDSDAKVDLVVAVRAKIAVPDVTKRHKDQAIAILERAGLVVGEVREKESESVRLGSVLSQVPPAGKLVSKGEKVDLVVATQILISVPSILGMPMDQAKPLLERAGLKVGAIREIQSRREPGTVLRQVPPAGEQVLRGKTVELEIALKSPPIQEPIMPNLIGSSMEAARTKLTDTGLRIGRVKSRASRELNPGTVYNQIPAAGTRLSRNMTIALFVVARSPIFASDQEELQENNNVADLDGGPDPKARAFDPRREVDLHFSIGQFLGPMNGGAIARVGGRPIGVEGCRRMSLSGLKIPLADLQPGTWFCFRTSQGRYSQFRIDELERTKGERVKISYTTWE